MAFQRVFTIASGLILMIVALYTLSHFQSSNPDSTKFRWGHHDASHKSSPSDKLSTPSTSSTDEPTTTYTRTLYITRTLSRHSFTTKTRSAAKSDDATHTNDVPAAAKTLSERKPVDVEMFVMSKCPDAAYCIHEMLLPLMANLSEAGKMTLTPSFIGTLTGHDGGVACKHGPTECVGNMVELCAYTLNRDNPKVWLPFYDCLGKDYRKIPDSDLFANCGEEHGVDLGRVNDCASSVDEDGGNEMLRRSFQYSFDQGIRASCTIRLAGKIRCVRDDGQWKDCPGGSSVEDIKRDIEKLYDEQAVLTYQEGDKS